MTNLQTVITILVAADIERDERDGWEPDRELPAPDVCGVLADALVAIGVDPSGYPIGRAS